MYKRQSQKIVAWQQRATERLEENYAATLSRLKADDGAQVRQIGEAHKIKMAQIERDHQRRWQELETDWKATLTPLCEALQVANDAAEKNFPPWEAALWKNWTPPAAFHNAAQFGRLETTVEKLVGVLPKDARLRWPGPATVSAPLALTFPAHGSICLLYTSPSPRD